MTDHEDGPPSRGPRRYGPSASGTPRPADGLPFQPRRPLDDELRERSRTAAARPAGSDAPRHNPPDRQSGTRGPEYPEQARAWSAVDRIPAQRAYLPPARPAAPDPVAHPYDRSPRSRVSTPQPRTGAHPPLATQLGQPAAPTGRSTARDRWAGRLWIGRLITAVLSVVTLLVSGFITFLSDTTGQQAQGIISDCAAGLACTGTTILLVGSDARVDAAGNPLSAEELRAVATEADGGGTSTDTMMLIHIPSGGGRATALSIPRDSWITDPPPGPSDAGDQAVPYAPNKVNSFYGSAKFYTAERMVAAGGSDAATIERASSDAGRKMLISVLEGVTGTHIDHYAEINLFGFYLLSNAIGGVPVCLINAVSDPFSGADFAAGRQDVQGTAALSFVRQRHGLPNGDLDRVKRQQAFLSGAIGKVLSVGTLTNPATLAALVDAANRSIVLSEGFNLLDLAGQMSTISSGNINFQTIPTHGPETSTAKDALNIDVAEVRSIFAGLDAEPTAPTAAPAAPAVDRAAVRVDVQNATVTSGLAKDTSDGLTAGGWAAGAVSQYPGTTAAEQLAVTSIRYAPGDEAAADLAKADLGVGEVQADSSLTVGRLLVVVGLDRAAGATTEAPTPAAAAPAAETINAAAPGCVN